MSEVFSLGEVARRIGIQPYRIAYAISTGQVPEASFTFLGKRCFTAEDIVRVAQHFGVSPRAESEMKGGAVVTAYAPIKQA